MTFAVDFDGVIHAYSRGWQDGTIYDEPAEGALEGLRTAMTWDAVFVLTSRDPEQVAGWLASHGFRVTTDDECPATDCSFGWVPPYADGTRTRIDLARSMEECPECRGENQLRFWNTRGIILVTNRKLPARAYVDDRAVVHEDWPTTLRELQALRDRIAEGGTR